MKLKDKVVIVTGGGRGIGRATALAFAKEGCNVAIIARTKHELEDTSKEIEKLGVQSLSFKGDVRLAKDVKDFVEETVSKFGKIDILVNNAGIALSKHLVETTEEEWDEVIDTNLKGIFLCSREVLPHMIKNNSGVIVNISSGAGKHGFANLSAYCASKFGVIGLTESLAKEVDKLGIKVFAVCPGAVATKMQDDISDGKIVRLSKILMMSPEHIAKKILELCLPDSKAKTGSCIEVYF